MSYVRCIDYWDFLSKQDDKDMVFQCVDDPEQRKAVFNKYVNIVHMELSTYCNRRCSYCPIAVYPREQEYMQDELFRKVIDELYEIGYTGSISLNLYNEPLYDEKLEDRIRRIKEKLPQCYIHFNSNGDKLTVERLESLWEAGLNQIRVTLQTLPNEEWRDEKKRAEFKRFLQKIGKEEYFEKRTETQNKCIEVEISFPGNRRFFLQCMNWSVYGADRGGNVKDLSIEKRTAPCIYPIREFCIACDGSVKVCCNMYFNAPDYGNIRDKGILDHYFGKPLVKCRKSVFEYGEKWGACSTCNSGIEFVPSEPCAEL